MIGMSCCSVQLKDLLLEAVPERRISRGFAVYEETAGLMVGDPVLRTHKVSFMPFCCRVCNTRSMMQFFSSVSLLFLVCSRCLWT